MTSENSVTTPSAPTSPSGAGLVVVGAVNVDLVVEADRLPGPGETVVGPRLLRFGGGKGANAAVAAARVGARVRLVGAVGDDDLGAAALDELRSDGVDVGAVQVVEGESTGVALIAVDAGGENQIVVGAGANAAVEPSAVGSALGEALRAGVAGCVLVSTEIPPDAVAAAVRTAREFGIPTVLNPAPPIPVVLDLLTCGPVLTPNRSELGRIAASFDVELSPHAAVAEVEAAARAVVAVTGAAVVVTLGSGGALVVAPGEGALHLPPLPTSVRDTTGAGDTFNGVLASRLALGDDLVTAARRANAAAALSVAGVGARGGMPRAADVEALLASS